MLRHRRFLQVVHRLALMGALLMAVAPVISRWVQSQDTVAGPMVTQLVQAMCHGQAMPMSPMPDMSHAGHAMPMSMGMSMPMKHSEGMPMPAGHDGMVCEYCVLAAQLLPFVLVLLLLPLMRIAAAPQSILRAWPRAAAVWPAHAARGPPELLVV